MKLIIAGSRDLDLEWELIEAVLLQFHLRPKEIVSGGARGVDREAERWADGTYKVTVFNADWETHGRKAGYLRNEEMGRYADALLAFWDGKSKGTEHMINIMYRLTKPIYKIVIDKYEPWVEGNQ